jgi:hypothetical protein
MQGRRVLASSVVAMLALVVLAACGAPARIQTVDREPDLVKVDGLIPSGFSSSAGEELRRLSSACIAIDRQVGTQLPDVAPHGAVTYEAISDGQCQWRNALGPELIIGILAHPGGGGVLDQTAMVIKDERPITGVGDRALFDLETRTLYVLKSGRLWYLQLVGSAPGATAPRILATLGRALVVSDARAA